MPILPLIEPPLLCSSQGDAVGDLAQCLAKPERTLLELLDRCTLRGSAVLVSSHMEVMVLPPLEVRVLPPLVLVLSVYLLFDCLGYYPSVLIFPTLPAHVSSITVEEPILNRQLPLQFDLHVSKSV
jgi:hypothetical protein